MEIQTLSPHLLCVIVQSTAHLARKTTGRRRFQVQSPGGSALAQGTLLVGANQRSWAL
jgi:hypothetical protein